MGRDEALSQPPASGAHLAARLQAWALWPPPVILTDFASQRAEAFEAESTLTLLILLLLILFSGLRAAPAGRGCWKLLGLAACLLVPLGRFAVLATKECDQLSHSLSAAPRPSLKPPKRTRAAADSADTALSQPCSTSILSILQPLFSQCPLLLCPVSLLL